MRQQILEYRVLKHSTIQLCKHSEMYSVMCLQEIIKSFNVFQLIYADSDQNLLF